MNGETKSRLKRWRHKKGYSQAWLAAELGVTQAMVSQYENLGLPDKASVLLNVASVTDISMKDLLSDVANSASG